LFVQLTAISHSFIPEANRSKINFEEIAKPLGTPATQQGRKVLQLPLFSTFTKAIHDD